MENYNVFKLYVLENDGIYYICKKEEEKYIDIFFGGEIEQNDIQYLASYYMVETMQKLAKGEEFILSKKELLLKFASLNSYKIYRAKEESYPWDYIKYQEDYLKAFKELSNIRPDLAKKIADEKIKKLNLHYED